MNPPACWQCKGPTELHPWRFWKKHPHPHRSFQCLKCTLKYEAGRMAVLLCAGCGETQVEWWYSLEELWEDVYECKYCEDVFCQRCYSDHKKPCKKKYK